MLKHEPQRGENDVFGLFKRLLRPPQIVNR